MTLGAFYASDLQPRASLQPCLLRRPGTRHHRPDWRIFQTIGPISHGRPFLRPSERFRHRDEESSGWCQRASLSAFLMGKTDVRNGAPRHNLESPLSAGQQKRAHVDSWAQRYILLVPNRCRVTTKLLTMFHQTSSSSSSAETPYRILCEAFL